MKKIIGEFKTFITRGNVVDMAVGVIVGGAFTAIVNGLSNFVFKPIINAIIYHIFKFFNPDTATDPLKGIYWMLVENFQKDPETGAILEDEFGNSIIDYATSIYVDWGAFISAIINFLLIALILFTIVKIINTVRQNHEKMANFVVNGKVTKEEKVEMKAQGLDFRSEADIEVYRAQKAKEAEEAAKAAEEAAALERLNNPTTEDLLKDIRDLLQNK